jgi:hypothetical protein
VLAIANTGRGADHQVAVGSGCGHAGEYRGLKEQVVARVVGELAGLIAIGFTDGVNQAQFTDPHVGTGPGYQTEIDGALGAGQDHDDVTERLHAQEVRRLSRMAIPRTGHRPLAARSRPGLVSLITCSKP